MLNFIFFRFFFSSFIWCTVNKNKIVLRTYDIKSFAVITISIITLMCAVLAPENSKRFTTNKYHTHAIFLFLLIFFFASLSANRFILVNTALFPNCLQHYVCLYGVRFPPLHRFTWFLWDHCWLSKKRRRLYVVMRE